MTKSCEKESMEIYREMRGGGLRVWNRGRVVKSGEERNNYVPQIFFNTQNFLESICKVPFEL